MAYLRYQSQTFRNASDRVRRLFFASNTRNDHNSLAVLDDPNLPLHNNLSESQIREHVKRRKISGGTRSEAGRQARDTFASLKKMCRLHEISFWSYLRDRLNGYNVIPRLSEFIKKAVYGDMDEGFTTVFHHPYQE
ncbi:hypothetical protein [Endozoicomonas atrinae]|uniref:hypothetical protein n=1 Tax=Endozoicomonas atrinae TaxID=1333660 RepID=UPI003B00260F